MCTMVHAQRNPVYDWFLNQQRLSFGGAVYERSSGLRTLIRELKNGRSCFFLPDEDLGRDSSRFINFLGVPKATVSTLPKLAKVTDAVTMQLFSVYNLKTANFEVHFSEPFADFPSNDLKTRPDESYPDIYENTHLSLWKKGKSIDYAARRRPFVEN